MKDTIKIINISNNDRGAVLIIVSIIIVALVIMGMFAMKSSTVESKVAVNDWDYTEDFFCADSGMDYLLTNYNFMGQSTISIGDSACLGDSALPSNYILPAFLSTTGTTACFTRQNDGVPDPAKHSITDFDARKYRVQSQNGFQTIISNTELIVPK